MELVFPFSFLVVGALFALGAGPIVGLPAEVLPPAARAFGMGVYFALYYAWMMQTPMPKARGSTSPSITPG